MRYIEIAEGLSIKIEDIVAISRGTGNSLNARVYTHHYDFKSTLPYNVLLELLKREQQDVVEIKDILKQQLNIQKQVGTPAW